MQRPNLIFLFADQLRASSLSIYGDDQIPTPNIERLSKQGMTFDNMIATCPVCTPYRAMLLTGRNPQTTGHVLNFVNTRHDEIGIGDAFSHAEYKTAWVGKWHLHRGSFPQIGGPDFVPEGRDRLGFQHWRGYNFHTDYFNGSVNLDDWHIERWNDYETYALNRHAFAFLDQVGNDPFCLFVSPHQPHATPYEHAPQEYYDRLPENLTLPENVPESHMEEALKVYRDYMAMSLTVDDMLGDMLDYLEEKNLIDNTIFIFTSDHGTQMGAQGWPPYKKKVPYEESLHVPMIVRWPGVFEPGSRCDTLTSPIDLFPTFCGLCNIPVPRTVEGIDLSNAWRGEPNAREQEAVFTMNFLKPYDYLIDGEEWRGVRTKTHSFARWLDGTIELYDLENDPLQMNNLADNENAQELRQTLEQHLNHLMAKNNDELKPASSYATWFDNQRRVIRNAHGPLGDPEDEPDWSLLV
ncbi:MAG: sulfatase [Candidatus Latescibacteria bacterium]|jgi:arylsulfatase A-like enzyme|nr:sulfatase [Candidatus Latescibacterota bacterium]